MNSSILIGRTTFDAVSFPAEINKKHGDIKPTTGSCSDMMVEAFRSQSELHLHRPQKYQEHSSAYPTTSSHPKRSHQLSMPRRLSQLCLHHIRHLSNHPYRSSLDLPKPNGGDKEDKFKRVDEVDESRLFNKTCGDDSEGWW
jgi:uncharacterized protein YijF (DUF1287 family)